MVPALEAAAQSPNLKVLALTVITSFSNQDLPETGLSPSVQQQVERLALLAASAGCQGVVASVHEAAYLKTILPVGSLIVTPGIQLARSGATDQDRVATPQAAVEETSDAHTKL